jgi:nicotinate phosphoribosyltransferase
VPVRYVFNNRRPEGKFNPDFMEKFQEEIRSMAELYLTHSESSWLKLKCPWLGDDYISYLENYRFDPREVKAELISRELVLEINGPWERTILWEVPLMALISELYFQRCDWEWQFNEKEQIQRAEDKANALVGMKYADFGTRRRRDFRTQNLVVKTMRDREDFSGTSNVLLAMNHGIKPIGTMAHEWIMGVSALESLRHANRYALRIWSDVYKGNLGIALPDTFGTAAFFGDFDGYLARLFDGVRHDSGNAFEFGDKVIKHYEGLRIEPQTKYAVFTDGLNVKTAREINEYFKGRIRVSFGIGTNFTNDFPASPPLNMVIKLARCNGIPVVKLSDSPGKAIGDNDALQVAKWTFFGQKLQHSDRVQYLEEALRNVPEHAAFQNGKWAYRGVEDMKTAMESYVSDVLKKE